MDSHPDNRADDGSLKPQQPPTTGNDDSDDGRETARKVAAGFWWTLVGLIGVTLSLVVSGAASPLFTTGDQGTRPEPVRPPNPRNPLEPVDPCKAAIAMENDRVGIRQELVNHLLRAPYPLTDQEIDRQIGRAFEPAYDRLGPLLDRHYSVRGQYEELILLTAGGEDLWIANRLFAGLETRLNTAYRHIRVALRQEAEQIAETAPRPSEITPGCGESDTLETTWDSLTADSADRFMAVTLPVGGIAALSGAVAAKTATTTATKAFGKKVLTLVAGKTGVKWLAKMLAGTGIGAGLGSFLGPLGTVGGTVVGGLVALISWLSVDAAAVGIDEHLHREELEHELRTLIDERKHALAEDIKTGMKESRRERLSESPQIAPARLRSGI